MVNLGKSSPVLIVQATKIRDSPTSELATQITNKYQQHLYDLAQSALSSSNET